MHSTTKERHKAYQKAYREKNSEILAEKRRIKRSSESYQAYRKEYYQKNKAKINEQRKKYKEKHKHQIAERNREKYLKNKQLKMGFSSNDDYEREFILRKDRAEVEREIKRLKLNEKDLQDYVF